MAVPVGAVGAAVQANSVVNAFAGGKDLIQLASENKGSSEGGQNGGNKELKYEPSLKHGPPGSKPRIGPNGKEIYPQPTNPQMIEL